MKSKNFARLLIIFFIIALILLLGIMIVANIKYGTDWKNGEITGTEIVFRELKTRYISQKNLSYNAYILGGSKAGYFQTSVINDYSNESFYNFYTSVGCFSNYERYTDFLIQQQKNVIQEIVLHLSTYETDYTYDDTVYIPIEMQETILKKIKSSLLFFKEKYLNVTYLKYLLANKKKSLNNIQNNGKKESNNMDLQPVLINYENNIHKLFYNEPKLRYCRRNLETLSRIKKECDKNKIQLKVVIGAHFISKYADQYGEDWNNYLRGLVSIVGNVWDFSGFNAVNKNPYNFVNEGHFDTFVADEIIRIMYSFPKNDTNMDSFGILLTKDNIEEYIASQKMKWNILKNEYDTTGTIKLFSKNDDSYLGK